MVFVIKKSDSERKYRFILDVDNHTVSKIPLFQVIYKRHKNESFVRCAEIRNKVENSKHTGLFEIKFEILSQYVSNDQ